MIALEQSQRLRNYWRDKYKITNRQLFELYSEFTALMMISRGERVEAAPDSFQSKFAKRPEGQDYLRGILPFPAGCLKSIGMERRRERDMKQMLSE